MEFDLSPLWISLKTAAIATIFALVLGTGAAGWMFAYRGKGKGIIDGIFTLPLVLPPTVLGFLLLLAFGRNSFLGQLLMRWGIAIIFSWSAAAIASTVVAFPLMYKTVRSAFEQVDSDLINCARTLGASENRIFWQVLLPLAWPGVIAGTILSFARALGEFGATLMFAGSIPGKTQTIPIAIFFAAEAGKMDEALIWVLIVVAIALGAIVAINYWSNLQFLSQSQFLDYWSSAINRWLSILGCWLLGLRQSRRPIPFFFSFFFSGRQGEFWRQREFWQQGDNGTKPHTDRFARQNSKPYNSKPRTDKSGQDNPKPYNSKPRELAVELYKYFPSFTLETQFAARGQNIGILGSSGSGKSMTLRCLAGLETPARGRIVLNGRVLFDSARGINIPARSRRIGFVFQNYALFPHMRVARNIGFGLSDLPQEEREQRVGQYIELMQLQGLEKRYPRELSGGQQQRVALARALAIAPEALLLDEPLSALDSYLRSRIEKLLGEVFSSYQGVALLVTHKLEEAYRVCDYLLVLSQGKVIASGSKQDIFERPPTLAVAQLTECKNLSRAREIDSQHIEALDWGCVLQVIEPLPNPLTYVGIRAHHLVFPQELPQDQDKENTFLCWLAMAIEAPHRVTLYLKLNSPAKGDRDYHLQAELFKEKWANLKNRPLPWLVCLAPLQLILMEK